MQTDKTTNRYNTETGALTDSNAKKRLSDLFDNGEYVELDRFAKNGDNLCEAVTACGTVNGVTVYAFSQNSEICGGAMGTAQADKLKRMYALAEKNGCPVIGIYDSVGGYIEDGVSAMTAYGELIGYAARLSGVVPQISVVVGACTGSARLLCDMADLTVVSKDAAEDFKEQYCAIADSDLGAVKTAALLLSYLPQNNLAEPLWSQYAAPNGSFDTVDNTVRAIADAGSALALYPAKTDCAKIFFARIGGMPAGIVAACPEDGVICGKGAKKIARFVRMCDAFSLPVVTLLDATEFGCAKCGSAVAHAYAEATIPKVTVIIGSAVGAPFIAMAGRASGADATFAVDGAVISNLKPCTAVQLLYSDRLNAGEDRKALQKEFAENNASPFNAAALGAIDDVILPNEISARVLKAIDALSGKRVSTLDKKHSNMPL